MTSSQALKQAKAASKAGGTAYVVFVPDEGRDVYDAEQMRVYAPLVFVEAAFVGGVQVSTEVAA